MALRCTATALRTAHRGLASTSKCSLNSARPLSTTVRYHKRGDPFKELCIETQPPLGPLGQDEVAIKMLFAPVNPSDLNQIEGTYGVLPALPAVGGQEGLGEVTAVGPGVKDLAAGDWVIPMPASGFGTWRTEAKAKTTQVMKVPNDIPAEYAACIGVNPCTAYRLLRDFVKLQPGDVIIQNAANSAVGVAVVQMAREMGVKTINLMRNRPLEEESRKAVYTLGGDIVWYDDMLHTAEFYDLISDLPPPKLALNCVGGRSAADMVRALGPKGVLVNFGGLSLKPVELPASVVAEKGIEVKGFWITEWAKKNPVSARQEMIEEIAGLIRENKLIMYLETHPFSQISNALERYYEPFKYRKVIMDMSI